MKVQLVYFKDSGKFYSEGEYESDQEFLWKVWSEVRDMMNAKRLPGLMEGHSDFYVHVNVSGHPHEHPRLMIPE